MDQHLGIYALLAALAVPGCTSGRSEAQRPPAVAGLHSETGAKQRLYGDPALVPTREGERARRELALEGEIDESLASLGLLERTHVSVILDPMGAAAPSAVVVARVTEQAPRATEAVQKITAAILGPRRSLELQLIPHPAPSSPEEAKAPATDPKRSLALALAILGLGVSLGVLGERLRPRLRAQAAEL